MARVIGVDQEGVWKSGGSDTFCHRLASEASPPQAAPEVRTNLATTQKNKQKKQPKSMLVLQW